MRNVLGVLGGVVIAAVGSPLPEYLVKTLSVSGLFIVLDTAVGLWLAFVSGKAQSRKAIQMLVSKIIQYLILLSLCIAASMFTGRWDWVLLCSFGIMGVEAMSLIETAIQLEKYGVNLGPLSKLIGQLKRFFAVMGQMDTENKEVEEAKKEKEDENDKHS